MRYSQILKTTISNLKGKKSRTILTIAGIAVGISTIVFLVSLGYGLQEFSINRISSINSLLSLDVSQGKTASFRLDGATVKKIGAISGVANISPILSLGGKATMGEKKTDIVATAVEKEYFSLEDLKLLKGTTFSDDEQKTIVSTALAQSLGKDPADIIGQNLNLSITFKNESGTAVTKDMDLEINGVIQDNTATFAYFPIKLISEYTNDNTVYSALKVKVEDKEETSAVRTEIENMGLTVTSVADTISQIDTVFGYVRAGLGALGGIALIVAAIGMFNTMTIALLERTRDIGIMKSLGIDNSDIYWMFLSEAVIIAGLGGLFGSLFGIVLSYAINFAINILAKIVGAETVLLFSTPLWFAGVIIAFSLLVGFSTGLYPSKRAAKINPLDALRYE